MNMLRRVPAPQEGDVLCFTVGLVFNQVSAETQELIRHRNTVEGLVTTEIESRRRDGAISERFGDGALAYTIGDVYAADGQTTVDVSIWWQKGDAHRRAAEYPGPA
jgi:hypothetical protein